MSAETSSGYKINKTLKIAIKRSKDSKGDVETVDRRKRGVEGNRKKSQSREDETVDTVPNWKRKRIYAESDMGEEGTFRGNQKGSSEGRNRLNNDFVKEKRTRKGISLDIELSRRKNSSRGESYSCESESIKDRRGTKSPQRIYADRHTGEEGTFHGNRKGSYKEGRNRVRDDFVKEKRTGKGRSCDIQISKRKNSSNGGSNSCESESIKDRRGTKSPQRIYADLHTGEEGTFHGNRKGSYKEGRNRVRDDFVKEKRTGKGRSCDIQISERKKSSNGGSNSWESESIKDRSSDKSPRSMWVSSGKSDATLETKQASGKLKKAAGRAKASDGELKTKGKMLDRMEYVKADDGSNDLKKKLSKSKPDSSKHLDQSLSKSRHSDVSLVKAAKKTVRYKKILDDDSAVMDVQPKKRKRIIRIDPHDISNKRIDDGIAFSEKTKEKKEDSENDVKLSKNAQFRAIQPSPSIISFVEDNLLGRRRLIELRRSGYNIELSAPLDNIPFSTSSERERIEETVFRNKLAFFAAAKVSSSFRPPDLPEIAFAGRSNVGKSSLLNALTRQWGVVRTSDKPGLTQSINFFNLGTKLCLVDLPGYGFAYAKEEVKDAWEDLVKEYVSTRVGLKQVCLLIDTKWGMKPRDHELIDLMERSQTKYRIVLTKTDVVFPIDIARRAMQIEESLKASKSAVQPLMMVSSKSGAGVRSLRMVLAKIARFAKP